MSFRILRLTSSGGTADNQNHGLDLGSPIYSPPLAHGLVVQHGNATVGLNRRDGGRDRIKQHGIGQAHGAQQHAVKVALLLPSQISRTTREAQPCKMQPRGSIPPDALPDGQVLFSLLYCLSCAYARLVFPFWL